MKPAVMWSDLSWRGRRRRRFDGRVLNLFHPLPDVFTWTPASCTVWWRRRTLRPVHHHNHKCCSECPIYSKETDSTLQCPDDLWKQTSL